ncbi:unnamed protein product [Kuraishia capsulata CBS 1993]|uniref:Uncharacterized protein n=1 Tax=Kuraishia capsulata CBS 1993 TaxID=1382522 RepID=W6MXX7_9ASCO|nr:uncharacterized protein KUCA_T00005648001 [Kuraishia capsulata CBS 1993]CDK29655.1 unnamed protein product [Kuraishia capsulata CBS 1993]
MENSYLSFLALNFSKSDHQSVPSVITTNVHFTLLEQHSLGAWDIIGAVARDRLLDGNGQRLESTLRSVVIVETPQTVHVDRYSGSLSKRLYNVRNHLAAQITDLLSLETQLHNGIRPV